MMGQIMIVWARHKGVWRTVVLGFEESRPVVQVVFMGRFIAAVLLAGHAARDPRVVTIGAMAWLAATVAVYAFNGMMDVAEDKGNDSRRPIASGRLTMRGAALFTAVVALTALAAGAVADIIVQIVVFLALGYAYSAPPRPAKRRGPTASMVIAALGLVTFWAGAQTGGGLTTAGVVFALVMSGWMGLVGAVVKDLGDVAGDALAGRRTFAVRHGAVQVACWGAGLAVAVGLSGVAAALAGAPSLLPSMLVLTAGAVVLSACCARVGRRLDGWSRSPYRAFMVAQYSAILTLIVSQLLC
jgi:4-hydroxybenzoate polyprenyltransferase